MKEQYPNTVALIRHSFYVDDLVVGTTSEAEALTVYQEANEIFEEAGKQLRKWTSSSLRFQEQFLQDGNSYDDTAQNTTEAKVLGLLWNRVEDEIFLRAHNVITFLTAHPPTKRTVLEAYARLFDPMGFVTPYTIRALIFFQRLWIQKISWDEPLLGDNHAEWTAWCAELPAVSCVRNPRCVIHLLQGEETSVEVHIFADASPQAYGTAIFVSTTGADNTITTKLLISKCRVAPIKTRRLNSSPACSEQGFSSTYKT